MKFLWEQDMV